MSHESPVCPFPRAGPVQRPITDADRRTFRYLRQLERDGVMELPTPGIIPRSWLWAVPLGLVIFIALIIIF
ncbi:hypothetical protein ACWIGW_45525 [Nocardia brasiliensis]